jgi:SAM-dependent methyltransferase
VEENSQSSQLHHDLRYYLNKEYITPARFLSLFEQLNLLASTEGVSSVLEIGAGSGAFQFFAKRMGKHANTLDHNEKLKPDYVASLLDPLPLENNQFDMVAAFEVFEHLPLSHLSRVLVELSRIARKYILFSVPDRNWYLRISIDTNYFRLRKLLSFRRLLKVWNTVDELQPGKDMHYWHIGDRGVSRKSIRDLCKASGLAVEKVFRSVENPSHHFFLLRSGQ